jgi:hypothetical protein
VTSFSAGHRLVFLFLRLANRRPAFIGGGKFMRSKARFITLCLGFALCAGVAWNANVARAQDDYTTAQKLRFKSFVQDPSTIETSFDLQDIFSEDLIERGGLLDTRQFGFSRKGFGAVSKRSYGPEQVIGPPDVPGYGDNVAAWCSLTEDGKPEWLLVEYARPIRPVALKIYETYYPGAVTKVSIFDPSGREVPVWRDRRPIPEKPDVNVLNVSLRLPYKITRVKIYISSQDYPGWHEIDAVGLMDANEKMHWADAVLASSTYAEPERPKADPAVNNPAQEGNAALLQRILQLEAEINRLREENAALKHRLNEPDVP